MSCDPSVTSPKSQLILQPFFRFSYVTSSSLNSPGESPMILRPMEALFSFSDHLARRASSDGSMSASGSAGPGFNPRRGSKF